MTANETFFAYDAAIPAPDEDAARATQAHWDALAMPQGSLGLLQGAVVRLAAAQGTADVRIRPRAVLVFCADNGVTAQGVACTPPEITAAMARVIAEGRSAVGRMAESAQTDVITADMGMFTRVDCAALRDCRISDGTKDCSLGPAMTREEAARAVEAGIRLAMEAIRERGCRLLATGEMGIGNTTTATATLCAFLGLSPQDAAGRGVGATDERLQKKINTIARALAVNAPDPEDALGTLAKVGGFDIAGMCGAFIGGALLRTPVLIDGVISAAAAVAAARLCPRVLPYMLASHVSAEPAAPHALRALGVTPLLQLNMRLGEGTGAVAAMPLLDAALAVYHGLPLYDELMG